ncbi:MAG: AIR synthase-related protein, partial [Acidimicrobiales bacterium]
GAGMDVYVSEVPQREPGMEPFEVLTSESQERMLAIVTPEHLEEVLAIAARWEIRASVVGTVTGSGLLRVLEHPDGPVLAEMPAKALEEDAPLYDRPRAEPADLAQRRSADLSELAATSATDAAVSLLAMVTATEWVSSQYDHQLFLNTVVPPGGDAAVLRLKHPTTGCDTGRALALTTDGNHRWCAIDPRIGSTMVVAEAVLNLACVGAKPLALVNCLNFGNPEHPEVMWQLAESVDGMGEACRGLGVPVVGGNVSLYNESRGHDIDPTPVVGILGVIEHLQRPPPGVGLVNGDQVVVVGPSAGSLAGSRFAWDRGHRAGSLAPVDLEQHRRVCVAVRELVRGAVVNGVHDVAEGGLALALAEMAVAGGVGVVAPDAGGVEDVFAEGSSRVVLSVAAASATTILDRLAGLGVAARVVGTAGGDTVVIGRAIRLDLAELTAVSRTRLATALGHGTTQQ